MVGGEHSRKISAPYLLRLGIDSVLNILNERITEWIHEFMNHKAVYRTAPATSGLLKTYIINKPWGKTIDSGWKKLESMRTRPVTVLDYSAVLGSTQ